MFNLNFNYNNYFNALNFFLLKFNIKTNNILKRNFKYFYVIVIVDNDKNKNYKNITMNLNNFYEKLFNFEKITILKNNNYF